MHRRLILVVVLCLAVAAVSGIGAAPAAAQGSCDCHTAVPPTDNAPAAHAPYVASVTDCTACHVNWTGPPHPRKWGPVLEFSYQEPGALGGWLGHGMPLRVWVGHPGVVVYLQQHAWGSDAWTDLTQVTTSAEAGKEGEFGYTVPSPMPWARYRAIAQGHVGPRGGLWAPQRVVWKPTPSLTLEVGGVTLGQRVMATGTALPTLLAGEKAKVTFQKRIAGKWVTRARRECTISATGTYGCGITPRLAGLFRARAAVVATADHSAARTAWIAFRVAR